MDNQDLNNKHSALPLYIVIGWIFSTMALWFFAFYQNPDYTSEWLSRAQAVCFGTDESGLPDTYGWAVLITAPLSFGIAIFVTFQREIKQHFARALATNSGVGGMVLLLLLFYSQGFWVTSQISKGLAIKNADYFPADSGRLPENYTITNTPAADFSLVNQHGENITLSSLQGKTVVLTFAFAHCTTICPAIVQNVRNATKDLPSDSVSLVVITLDPWRDIPSSLPYLATKWELKEGQHVLSGEINDVTKTIADYNVPTSRKETDGDITHPAIVYLISSTGKVGFVFNNPTSVWIRDGITRLLQQQQD